MQPQMYFTLLFETPGGPTEIYELVFHPSPVWFRGGQTGLLEDAVCQPSHRGPRYVAGDFRSLLDSVEIKRNRKVLIVCHNHSQNHGTIGDLKLLMSDIESEGFYPELMLRDPSKMFDSD